MEPSRFSPQPTAVKGIPGDAISALGILRETLRIPSKNRQLVLFVTLLVFLPYILLFLFKHFLFHPQLYAEPQDMQSNGLRDSKIGLDGSTSKLVEFSLSAAYWFLDSFEVLITTLATTATYSADFLTPVELLKRMRREWRGPFVTQLYVAVLRKGYWALHGTFSDDISPAVAGGPAASLLVGLGTLLSLSGYLLYYYLDVAWESSVPSAVVDGGGGLSALGVAAEFTKERRLRGAFVMFFYGVACEAVDLVFDMLFRLTMPEAILVVLAVGHRSMCELLYMLKVAAFTVFYYECAESSEAEESQYASLC